ncbi:MAG: fibronectin type III domain-containing protein, partial [Clostridiales bacterium]
TAGPPSPPTSLSATTVSSSQIDIKWSAPANNGGSPITGYKVERYANSTWSTIVANTGTMSGAYSDKGLLPSTTYTYRTSAINSAGTGQPSNTATATTLKAIHPVTLSQSGLVVSDSLTNETKTQQQLQSNPRYWVYGGDAPEEHAQYDFFKDPKGLHVGARAPANDTWAGYFAVSPNTNAMLFHSVLTTPVSILPYQFFENGMYIQTSQPFVNYVTCVSVTGADGTEWAVVSTLGNASQANQFNVLYVDPSPNQSLTRDCTIITNGSNYLKVYLDGNMVYNNSTMNLQMPEPLNTYLEPQSSYPGKLLNGTYSDYYAATSENIQVNNLPSGATRVDLVNSSGSVITSGTVISGSATLDVGRYHFPLVANIKAYDSANSLIASTSSVANIYGGDVYLSH